MAAHRDDVFTYGAQGQTSLLIYDEINFFIFSFPLVGKFLLSEKPHTFPPNLVKKRTHGRRIKRGGPAGRVWERRGVRVRIARSAGIPRAAPAARGV